MTESIEKLNGNIAIISHSGANETFINLIQKRKKENFLKLKQDNACINHIRYKDGEWRIISMNDTSHLEDFKPEVEYYENMDNIHNKLLEFLKTQENILSDNLIFMGDLAKNKIGKYKRVFRRYFGTPLKIVTPLSNEKIKKEWKIVHISKDYIEYGIGGILIKDIKYKVNLIIPNKYEDFILKNKRNLLFKRL